MTQKNTANCPYSCDKSEVIDQTAQGVIDLKTIVDRIDRALQGDEYHPNGLVGQRAKDHKRIVRIERFIWSVSGGVTVGFAVFKLFIQ